MTNRDSVTASVPSPRDLHMASEHELDVPMTLTSGADPCAWCFQFFQSHLPTSCSASADSMVHTHTLKIFEYGNRSAEWMVEEKDSSGHARVRSMEPLFYESLVMLDIDMDLQLMAGIRRLNWPTTGVAILGSQKILIHTATMTPQRELRTRMGLPSCPIHHSPLFRSLSWPGSCTAFYARIHRAMSLFYRL